MSNIIINSNLQLIVWGTYTIMYVIILENIVFKKYGSKILEYEKTEIKKLDDRTHGTVWDITAFKKNHEDIHHLESKVTTNKQNIKYCRLFGILISVIMFFDVLYTSPIYLVNEQRGKIISLVVLIFIIISVTFIIYSYMIILSYKSMKKETAKK